MTKTDIRTQARPPRPAPRQTMLTRTEAAELARSLEVTGDGLTLSAQVCGDWISFSGGRQGSHGVAIGVSSRARVLAHWQGYCQSNGLLAPTAPPARGDVVRFPSRSSRSGTRVGEVLRVTPTRCRVGYRFDYQRGEGPLREAWHPLSRVEVLRRR